MTLRACSTGFPCRCGRRATSEKAPHTPPRTAERIGTPAPGLLLAPAKLLFEVANGGKCRGFVPTGAEFHDVPGRLEIVQGVIDGRMRLTQPANTNSIGGSGYGFWISPRAATIGAATTGRAIRLTGRTTHLAKQSWVDVADPRYRRGICLITSPEADPNAMHVKLTADVARCG